MAYLNITMSLCISPVQILSQFRMLRIIHHQLIEHPWVDGDSEPFPSVDATVYPHGRLLSTSTPTNLQKGGEEKSLRYNCVACWNMSSMIKLYVPSIKPWVGLHDFVQLFFLNSSCKHSLVVPTNCKYVARVRNPSSLSTLSTVNHLWIKRGQNCMKIAFWTHK